MKAMQEDLDALHANHTWDIVSCPDGSLDHHKARLVALGNR